MEEEGAVPKVSVCVMTYHHERYIKDCVVSVLAQLPDVSLEILVGDDGSGPETAEIMRRLMARHPGVIQYFHHERNLGPTSNCQFLMSRARGSYVAILDGDDFWLPGKLAAQVAWLDAHPQSPACYTNAVVIDDHGVVTGVFHPRFTRAVDLAFLLERGNFLNHSSMLFRAAFLPHFLAIKEPYIDYRMHLMLARQGVLGLVHRELVVYRQGSAHSMVRVVPQKVHAMYFEALGFALADPAVSRATRRAALVHFWRSIVLRALLTRHLADLWRWSAKFRAAYPRDHLYVIMAGTLWAGWRVVRALGRKLTRPFRRANELRVLYER